MSLTRGDFDHIRSLIREEQIAFYEHLKNNAPLGHPQEDRPPFPSR